MPMSKTFIGSLCDDTVKIWWIPFNEDEGMFRVVRRSENVFLCGSSGCSIDDNNEEDDFPFLMPVNVAYELYRVLKANPVRFLSKSAWAEYIAFEGYKPKVAASTFSGDASEVLLSQMKKLSSELQASRDEKRHPN